MDGLGPVGFSIGNDGGGGGCWSILRWRGVSLCVPWPRCAQNMMGNILKENVDIVELPLRLSLRVGALAHCLFACVQCVCATCPRCVCVCTRVCGDSERQQDPERRSISALTSSSAASLLPATHLSKLQPRVSPASPRTSRAPHAASPLLAPHAGSSDPPPAPLPWVSPVAPAIEAGVAPATGTPNRPSPSSSSASSRTCSRPSRSS